MTDLLRATLDATFEALDVPLVTALAPVYTSVPAGTEPPFVEIGLIDADAADGDKLPGLEQHTIEINFRTRGGSRLPLLALMHAGRVAFEGASISQPGALLEPPIWRASATDRDDDGVTWHGVHRFDLYAQPA